MEFCAMLTAEECFQASRPLRSIRDKYGINTDEIRIDPVFIP